MSLALPLFSAASRATYYLRVCRASVTVDFARQHDANVWQLLLSLLGHQTHDVQIRERAALPTGTPWYLPHCPCRSLGRLGWLLPHNQQQAWSHRTQNDRSVVFALFLRSPCEGSQCVQASLAEVGFVCPEWTTLEEGLRPQQPALDEVDPGQPTHGWQYFAALAVECGPNLGPCLEFLSLSFLVCPTVSPRSSFACSSIRRLWPPFRSPLAPAAPCSVSESRHFGSRGFSVERVVARVCR